MIQKRLKLNIEKDSYEFDSLVLFVINIIVAASNYGIVLIINFQFPDVLTSWLAASGLVTIITAPLSGVGFLIIKRFSEIAHKYDSDQAKSIFISHLITTIPLILLFLPFIFLFNRFLVPEYTIFSTLLLLATVLSQILYSVTNSFIIGILEKKLIVYASIAIIVLKVAFSLIFLSLGFKYDALLIAILISNLGFVGVILYSIIVSQKISIQKVNLTAFIIKIIKEMHNIAYLSIGVQLLTWIFYGLSIIIDRNFDGVISQTIALAYLFAQILHFGTISILGGFITHAAKDDNRNVIKKAFYMVWSAQLLISLGILICSAILQLLSNQLGHPEWSQLLIFVPWMLVLTMCFNYIFMSVQYAIAKETYILLLYLIPASFVMLCYFILVNNGVFIGQIELITSSLIIFVITAIIFHLHIHFKKI